MPTRLYNRIFSRSYIQTSLVPTLPNVTRFVLGYNTALFIFRLWPRRLNHIDSGTGLESNTKIKLVSGTRLPYVVRENNRSSEIIGHHTISLGDLLKAA